mmetsp:Transcript_30595/g.89536  ORF Transcript_30595/g.89536 Transcript_30595/m.89536 type:complete len:91 (-) Transcript_30595:739-1011(-)
MACLITLIASSAHVHNRKSSSTVRSVRICKWITNGQTLRAFHNLCIFIKTCSGFPQETAPEKYVVQNGLHNVPTGSAAISTPNDHTSNCV